MKFKFLLYFIIITFLTYVFPVNAILISKSCLISKEPLPNCDTNEFLADDNECYHCADPNPVEIGCNMSEEQVQKICPNRYSYGTKTYLKCPEDTLIKENHICKKTICAEGEYTEDGEHCCPKETKFIYLENGKGCCEFQSCEKENIEGESCCSSGKISSERGDYGVWKACQPRCARKFDF